jgi:NSS family neurotransmitter:Na+ symporter
MSQSFFTLSIGLGMMAIFGSYIGKTKRLGGEAILVTALDTAAAFSAGLMVIPACIAFGLTPTGGPGLLFVVLPNVFNLMELGRIWGTLFFFFVSFAALTTVVAVFENIVLISMEITDCSRIKASTINCFAIIILSLPCALGFNLLSWIHPIGKGSVILDLEDFIFSNNLLPLGALAYCLFCASKKGWGFTNFLVEANTGKGFRLSEKLKIYYVWGLPLLLLTFYICGYVDMLFKF